MKTNVVKSVLLAVALSFAFTACQNDPVINEVENGLEKKKVNMEHIRPYENHNDRELERELLRELPIKEVVNTSTHSPLSKNNISKLTERSGSETIKTHKVTRD